jgi:hypothetical protein
MNCEQVAPSVVALRTKVLVLTSILSVMSLLVAPSGSA